MKLPTFVISGWEPGYITYEKHAELIVDIYTTKDLVLANVGTFKFDNGSVYLMDYNNITIHGKVLSYYFDEYGPHPKEGPIIMDNVYLETRKISKIKDKTINDNCNIDRNKTLYRIELYNCVYHDIFLKIKRNFQKIIWIIFHRYINNV